MVLVRDAINAMFLAEAFSSFHQREFENAYDNLIHITFISLRHRLVARPLIARCLFEMQLEDEKNNVTFNSELNAFEQFIKRNKSMNRAHKIPYLNFISTLRQIAKGFGEPVADPQYWKGIIVLLESKKPIIAKGWLMQRLKELAKERGILL